MPGLHNHPTSIEMVWDELDSREGKAVNKCSACGISFKTVGKAFQVKQAERMPRACKAVFGYYMIPYVLFHS
jgi:hypothetical protein